MDPLTWLLSNIDLVNQRTSKEVFKVTKLTGNTAEVLHRDTGETWRFECTNVSAERRLLDRTKCGIGGCDLPPHNSGNHRIPCGCINGCAAWGCTNV